MGSLENLFIHISESRVLAEVVGQLLHVASPCGYFETSFNLERSPWGHSSSCVSHYNLEYSNYSKSTAHLWCIKHSSGGNLSIEHECNE